MTDIIPVTGLTSTWRVPGDYSEVIYGAGPGSGNTGTRAVLFVGPKQASGTYTVNTVYQVNSESDVVTGAGAKSALRRMVGFFLRANKGAKVYVLPYAETNSGSPVKAVSTYGLSGTASGTGQWTLSVGRRSATITFVSGDAAADIAADMRAALTTIADLPVDISGSSGDVTMTAAQYGARGGTSTYKPIRVRSNTPGNGLTVTSPGDLGATTPGADGTTTEASLFEAALSAISGQSDKYYIVTDLGGDATAMAALKTFLGAESAPLVDHRASGISARVGTKASAISASNALNFERITVAYGTACKNDPAEVAANLAAVYQKRQDNDPTFNFDGYSQADWLIESADSSTEWIDETDTNDLINGGLTPIYAGTGKTSIVMAVTTRTLDSTGTYADYRAYEVHRVSAGDAWAAHLQSLLSKVRTGDASTGGAKIADHPRLSSGLPDPNAKLSRGVVTTFNLRPTVVKAIDDGVEFGWLQRAADSMESLNIVRSTDNTGRLLIGLNLYTIDLLHQLGVRIAESTAG